MTASALLATLFLLLAAKVDTGAHTGPACHVDPCQSSATTPGGTLLACPAGDGPTLFDIGATIDVTVLGCTGDPVQGIPGADLWIIPQDYPGGGYSLCDGSRSSDADYATDNDGHTTMSGAVAAGGYFGSAVYVVVEGSIVDGPACPHPEPLALTVVSPDMNADGTVDILDFGLFGNYYASGTDPRADFNGDGQLDSLDFSDFGNHYGHACTQ
jgi:hypothetical protein